MGLPFPNVDDWTSAQQNFQGLPQGAELGLRFVRGTVNSDGSIASGDGFTVQKAGTTYAITFNPPFLDTPSVQPMANDGNTAALTLVTKTGASVTTTGASFNFIAMGLNGALNA